MLYLHTGLPGAGKTLCTIAEVNERAEKENRPVFYNGIADLKLPWIPLDKGEDWHTLPAGAIVVLDEAQRIFRPRGTGSAVPEHVSKLETHRHHGYDIYVITQHPKLIDNNVRRLVGTHVHFVRAFGTQAVTRHEWGEVQEDPAQRGDSQRRLVPYPKEAYKWYKSAEVHTHKRKLPRAVFFLVLGPVLLGLLGWLGYSRLMRSVEVKGKVEQTVGQGVAGAGVSGKLPEGSVKAAASGATLNDWLLARRPRVEGLPFTAPVYDAVTQVAEAPYPAACIRSESRGCQCFTQQATPIEVPLKLCEEFVRAGIFISWQTKSGNGSGAVPAMDRASGPASARDHAPGQRQDNSNNGGPGGASAVESTGSGGWSVDRKPWVKPGLGY